MGKTKNIWFHKHPCPKVGCTARGRFKTRKDSWAKVALFTLPADARTAVGAVSTLCKQAWLSWHCKIMSLSPRDGSGKPLPPQPDVTLPSEAPAASEIGAGRTTCQRHWHPFYRANSVLVALESEHETHLSPRNRKAQDISFQVEDQPKPNGHSGPCKAPFLSLDCQEMPPFPVCSHCFLQSTLC